MILRIPGEMLSDMAKVAAPLFEKHKLLWFLAWVAVTGMVGALWRGNLDDGLDAYRILVLAGVPTAVLAYGMCREGMTFRKAKRWYCVAEAVAMTAMVLGGVFWWLTVPTTMTSLFGPVPRYSYLVGMKHHGTLHELYFAISHTLWMALTFAVICQNFLRMRTLTEARELGLVRVRRSLRALQSRLRPT
jgi:hypothetical protein